MISLRHDSNNNNSSKMLCRHQLPSSAVGNVKYSGNHKLSNTRKKPQIVFVTSSMLIIIAIIASVTCFVGQINGDLVDITKNGAAATSETNPNLKPAALATATSTTKSSTSMSSISSASATSSASAGSSGISPASSGFSLNIDQHQSPVVSDASDASTVESGDDLSTGSLPDSMIMSNNQRQNLASNVDNQINRSKSTSTVMRHHQLAEQQQQQQQQPMTPPKLPKINIFINKSEIKKLLGIDARINYVSAGNINTYPFGFTIPMGYNQSDIIFTWQNLGLTNVNYSISLIIGNIQAVNAPQINITRSGLIPRHEQVFKITLPCSGKVTDEVDVQVLINIAGLVPSDQIANQFSSDDAGASSPVAGSGSGDEASPASSSSSSFDLQSAIASHREQLRNNSTAQTVEMSMQADDPQSQLSSNNMRLVTHTLAIKRKKICTMHPVPIQPPKVRPPNQPRAGRPTQDDVGVSPRPAAPQMNRWQQQQQQQSQQTASIEQASTTENTTTNNYQAPEAPAHHPSLGLPAELPVYLRPLAPINTQTAQQVTQTQSQQAAKLEQPAVDYPNWSMSVTQPPQTPITPENNPINDLLIRRTNKQSQTPSVKSATGSGSGASAATASAGVGSNPLLFTLMLMSIVVSIALLALLLLTSSSATSSGSSSAKFRASRPFDKLSSITSCILRRGPSASGRQAPGTGSGRRPTGQTPTRLHQQLVIGGGGGVVASRHQATVKTSHGAALIGALNANNQHQQHRTMHQKSISGLSSNSSQSMLANKLAYCTFNGSPPGATNQMASKWNDLITHQMASYPNYATNTTNNNNNAYYSTLSNTASSNQHHYSPHPPTADLLGTGYLGQQQQQQTGSNNSNYPIYHIAANNTSQTTRLIWQQGNGTSPDGFTIEGGSYMPLASNNSNNNSTTTAATDSSDGGGAGSGSVYQTIY